MSISGLWIVMGKQKWFVESVGVYVWFVFWYGKKMWLVQPGGGDGEGYSFVVCLSLLTIDHASLRDGAPFLS